MLIERQFYSKHLIMIIKDSEWRQDLSHQELRASFRKPNSYKLTSWHPSVPGRYFRYPPYTEVSSKPQHVGQVVSTLACGAM